DSQPDSPRLFSVNPVVVWRGYCRRGAALLRRTLRDRGGRHLSVSHIFEVVRSISQAADGSRATYVWTDYLSKISGEWAKSVGKGTSVKWPVGLGGKGNEGVAAIIKNTANSIGYIELIYAIQSDMPFGEVRNKAGKFIKADLASASAAAAGVQMPDDFRVSITNSSAPDAYPIASFTWLLIPQKIADPAKKRAITNLLNWLLTDGQGMTSKLSYAPLPKSVADKELKAISTIQ